MPHSYLSDPARPVCIRTPHGRVRGAQFFAAVAALVTLFLGTGIVANSPASAEDDDQATALAITAVGDITAPLDGQFLGTNSVTITGKKAADSTVVVTVNDAPGCTPPASDAPLETWSCAAILPNGPDIEITATETLPDDTTEVSTVKVDVLGPPTIAGGSPQLTTGVISGSGHPGAIVTLATNPEPCPAVNPDGYWSCTIASPSGTYGVTASQSHADIGEAGDHSGASRSVTVTVDKNPPAAPVITSPRANSRVVSQPITVTGTGENHGRVDVYVDGVPRCSATVSGSSWSCQASGFTGKSNTIQAVLRDAAGNYAVGNSAPIHIFFGPAPVKPAPVPVPVPVPAEPDNSTPTPTPTLDDSTLPWGEQPIFPGPDGQGPTLREALTNWGSPTEFGAELPTVGETIAHGNWAWAPLLAVAFISLIALPLRMLASALRGRFRLPRANLLGRNRTVAVDDGPIPRNPWLLGLVPLAATAGLIVLSEGINGEVRYLRLLFAVGLGLAILNVVGVALTIRFASVRQKVGSRLRFVPLLLLATAISALLSRWTGIEPPVVTGVLIGAGFALAVPARPRAIVNLAQVGAILGLAVLAWFGHGWLGDVVGFWASVLSETLATICLVGVGSTLVLMLPLGPLPGRVVLEWSAKIWLGAIFIVATIAGAITLGGPGAQFPILVSALIVLGFAAICAAVWAWVRYVETAPA